MPVVTDNPNIHLSGRAALPRSLQARRRSSAALPIAPIVIEKWYEGEWAPSIFTFFDCSPLVSISRLADDEPFR